MNAFDQIWESSRTNAYSWGYPAVVWSGIAVLIAFPDMPPYLIVTRHRMNPQAQPETIASRVSDAFCSSKSRGTGSATSQV